MAEYLVPMKADTMVGMTAVLKVARTAACLAELKGDHLAAEKVGSMADY